MKNLSVIRTTTLVLLLLVYQGTAVSSVNTLSMSPSELKNYPAVVEQGLLQSLMKADIKGVNVFLPFYTQTNPEDDFLMEWGLALQAKFDRHYDKAIRLYRKLLAHYPDIDFIRLQLAITFFENKDNDSAEKQFRKLQTSQTLPREFQHLVEIYLKQLQARDGWQFTTALSYLNEKNINNAPAAGTRIGNWTASKPESAQGLSYGLVAQKMWSLPQGWFSEYRFSGFGKRFWNNAKYDELSLRNSAGLGYRNIDLTLSVLPFYEQQFYGGGNSTESPGLARYAKASGLQLENRVQLSTHWRLYTHVEYKINRYSERQDANGYDGTINNSLYYIPSPEQYVFIGTEYQYAHRRARSLSYQRYAGYLGWGYEWNAGLSSQIRVGYAEKNYQGKDFWLIQQMDHDYSGSLTLWHRNLYFYGMTPKLTWLYQRTDSNHPFYDVEKNRLIWSISKEF